MFNDGSWMQPNCIMLPNTFIYLHLFYILNATFNYAKGLWLSSTIIDIVVDVAGGVVAQSSLWGLKAHSLNLVQVHGHLHIQFKGSKPWCLLAWNEHT